MSSPEELFGPGVYPLPKYLQAPAPNFTLDNAKTSQPVDDITNPAYYRANGMEAIDVIEAFNLGYTLGNAVKYIVRAGKKGSAVDDLRKAAWYINREISRLT